VWDAGTGTPEGVTVAFEVGDEGGTDFVHWPLGVGGEDGLVVGHGEGGCEFVWRRGEGTVGGCPFCTT
jgi:hypothetical protein